MAHLCSNRCGPQCPARCSWPRNAWNVKAAALSRLLLLPPTQSKDWRSLHKSSTTVSTVFNTLLHIIALRISENKTRNNTLGQSKPPSCKQANVAELFADIDSHGWRTHTHSRWPNFFRRAVISWSVGENLRMSVFFVVKTNYSDTDTNHQLKM